MLGLAALLLAAASASSSPTLTTSSWWEKVTYTISGDGAHQSCQYESSFGADDGQICAEKASTPIQQAASGSTGSYTKITIERRFTPAQQPLSRPLGLGDTLLGGQVMALSIDEAGTVRSCKVLAASGDVRPSYGCEQARAERFQASASSSRSNAPVLQGYMTILVYGHEEQLA